MFNIYYLILLFLSCLNSFASSVVSTYNYEPFVSGVKNGSVSGEVIDVFNCASKDLFSDYKFEMFPRRRAVFNLKKKDSDFLGLVPYSGTEENRKAFVSYPVAIERWVLLSKSNIKDFRQIPDGFDIGVLRGSLIEDYFKKTSFKILDNIEKIDLLVKSLIAGRVDGIIINQFQLKKFKDDLQNFSNLFIRYNQVSVLFNENINLKKLEKFNLNTKKCINSNFQLTKQEEAKLISFSRSVLEELLKKEAIHKLTSQKKKLSKKIILERDSSWSKKNDFTNLILESELSKNLKDLKINFERSINEIFVFGLQGELLGSSDFTSDYFQGDELKYTEIYFKKKPYLISPIEFDDSTRNFQVQITLPLKVNNKLVSIVTMGINIEEFFKII